MLHIPYRGDVNNLLAGLNNNQEDHTWKEMYESANITEYTNPTTTIAEDEGDIPQCIEDYMFQTLAQCTYGFLGNQEIKELGHRPIDNDDWLELSKNCPSMEEGKRFWKTTETEFIEHKMEIDYTEIRMSSEQTAVLEILDSQIKYLRSSESITENVLRIPKECIVQGRAGCGKSTLIKEMVRRITSEFGAKAVAVTAPTGIATVEISGVPTTINSNYQFQIAILRD